ncbi:MAG: hypothetical protein R3B68_08715 [Phycisphaerales bacterium]
MPPRFPLPPEDLWPELHDRDSSLFAELLAAYFHDTANALELAHATGLSLRQLATWRNSPVAREAIDQIRTFEEQRARDLAARAASAAVERLVTILAANTNTESARKAASLLLRISNITSASAPPPPRAAKVPARLRDTGGGSTINPTPPPLDASMPPASMPSPPSSPPPKPSPNRPSPADLSTLNLPNFRPHPQARLDRVDEFRDANLGINADADGRLSLPQMPSMPQPPDETKFNGDIADRLDERTRHPLARHVAPATAPLDEGTPGANIDPRPDRDRPDGLPQQRNDHDERHHDQAQRRSREGGPRQRLEPPDAGNDRQAEKDADRHSPQNQWSLRSKRLPPSSCVESPRLHPPQSHTPLVLTPPGHAHPPDT